MAVYRFGPFEFDEQKLQLRRDGDPVSVPNRPRDLLCLLVKNPDCVVSREAIKETLWPDEASSVERVELDDRLKVCVHDLRRILQDNPDEPHYIKTIQKEGYRFLCAVTVVSDRVRESPIQKPSVEDIREYDPRYQVLVERARAETQRLRARGPILLLLVALSSGLGLVYGVKTARLSRERDRLLRQLAQTPTISDSSAVDAIDAPADSSFGFGRFSDSFLDSAMTNADLQHALQKEVMTLEDIESAMRSAVSSINEISQFAQHFDPNAVDSTEARNAMLLALYEARLIRQAAEADSHRIYGRRRPLPMPDGARR